MTVRPSSLRIAFALALASLVGCVGSSVIGQRPDAGDDIALDLPSNPDTPLDSPADTVDATRPCASNSECSPTDPARRVCDRATGRCVPCTATDDVCPAAQRCDAVARQCVDGCRADDGCTTGAARRCDTAMHACVECTRDDHCAAGQLCMSGRCAMGCNAAHACPAGQSCCGSACVSTQTTVEHCGRCDNRCALANATATCAAGACAVGACTGAFRDCDMMAANGCETDTQTSATSCGGCGMACAARPHATASCADGACRYACDEGFGDCDGMTANGCETDTRASTDHCGMCGQACRFANALPVCVLGSCVLGGCESGFANCDAMAANGCEVDTNNSGSDCGACGRACAPPNATGRCTVGVCAISTCAAGFSDCDHTLANGCEVSTATSLAHCGMCGRGCAPINAVASCAAGACGFTGCNTGFANCNGNLADGCELNLSTARAAPAGIVTRFAVMGSGVDQTVQEAISVSVGPSGSVYVLSYNDKILVFDADGRFVRNYARMGWTTAYDFVVDRATGQMWLVDPNTNVVTHLTAAGAPSESWPIGAGSRGIDFARGEVFVSDAAGNRVQVFTPAGTLLRSITTSPPLTAPRGLAVGASGNLYVASYTDNSLRILSPTGTQIRQIPTIGNPSDVAVDECRGVVYVLGEASDMWAAHLISDGTRLYTQPTATGTSHAGLSINDDGSRLYVALNHNAGRGVNLYLR